MGLLMALILDQNSQPVRYSADWGMGNGHHGGQGLQVKEGGGEHPEETSTATPAKNGAKRNV